MLGVVSLTVMRDAVDVMGAVQDDARIVQGIKPQPSQGGDDVWVAMLDKATGDVSWITQLGSKGDDRVAPHASVVVTSQGVVLTF
jgi:hypothetical protein